MMRTTRQLAIKLCYICIDILAFCLAIVLACWIRHSTLPFEVTGYGVFFDSANPFRFIFLIWVIAIVLINNSHGLYQTKRGLFETVEIWEVIKSALISSLLIVVVIYLTKLTNFPRSILFLVIILTSVFSSLWRIIKRFFVEYLVARGYNNFNVLVIGAGKVGRMLAQEIAKKPALGLNIVGYLDDFKKNESDSSDPKILGKFSDFIKIARKEFVNKVFITEHRDSNVFLQMLEDAKELGVAVHVIPHGFELMSGEFSKYNIGIVPILEYCNGQARRKQAGKRFFDFLAAVCLAVFAFPAILIISVLIKMDSPGPVFYLSRRYGRGGRIFDMIKFRSMQDNADKVIDQISEKNEMDGPIFKIRDDPRVTKIGKFLRKYSLDELPQILNVIKGNMSLVGPRPLPIAQVEREDFQQLRRLEVRPGITGLWQIRGRSDISFSRLVKWDVWYINNWSFWLDLNILFQTFPVVLKGRGAY